jgi:hypothetical protein
MAKIMPSAFNTRRFLGCPLRRCKAVHGLVRECPIGYDNSAECAFFALQSVGFPREHSMAGLHFQELRPPLIQGFNCQRG